MTSAQLTFAALARSTTGSRSALKASSARWQWESTSTPLCPLSNPSARRRRLVEAHKQRLAAVRAGRQHHAVRFDTHELARLQVQHDGHRSADQCGRLIHLGDARYNRTLIHPRIDE